jgi:hypothetical protein
MNIVVIDALDTLDLPSFYASQGHIVLVGPKNQRMGSGYLLVELLTCVGITKRLLGLRNFWIWTPWQLFSSLARSTSKQARWRIISGHSLERRTSGLTMR